MCLFTVNQQHGEVEEEGSRKSIYMSVVVVLSKYTVQVGATGQQ